MQIVTGGPVMCALGFLWEFILLIDWSVEGLGAALEQLEPKEGKLVVAYFSRSLNLAEKN